MYDWKVEGLGIAISRFRLTVAGSNAARVGNDGECEMNTNRVGVLILLRNEKGFAALKPSSSLVVSSEISRVEEEQGANAGTVTP